MTETQTFEGGRPGSGNSDTELLEPGSVESGAQVRGKKRGPVWAGALVLALLAVIFGARYLHFASTHTTTDDAYISGDVIQISPQVSGTVTKVGVSDNEVVSRGTLLAVLDDATYRANVAQAQANLDAAIAQATGAGVSVNVTRQTGGAVLEQAEGQVAQADAGISSAEQGVARANAGIATAAAQARSEASNITTLRAGVAAAAAAQGRADAAVKSAEAQIAGAKANVSLAQAGIDSAQAAYDRAAGDAQRYASLARQGAGSRQMADQAATSERAARANLQAAQRQLDAANAALDARESELTAARQQVAAAAADVAQARARVESGRDQASAAEAVVAEARAQRDAAQQGVSAAGAMRRQALGQLSAARVSPRQVAVSRSAHDQAIAKIEQARAALDQAKLQLGYTRIYAPVTGRVSKKSVEVGALVQPGTPLMAIIPLNAVWLIANLKETQLAGVRPGDDAEIRVDAFPGQVYRGKVENIAAATGSTFALLPPDNASGNFTKVVQRIPVKILLDPGQPGLDRLSVGMSVDVTITTG